MEIIHGPRTRQSGKTTRLIKKAASVKYGHVPIIVVPHVKAVEYTEHMIKSMYQNHIIHNDDITVMTLSEFISSKKHGFRKSLKILPDDTIEVFTDDLLTSWNMLITANSRYRNIKLSGIVIDEN
jgi:hypothetical protein